MRQVYEENFRYGIRILKPHSRLQPKLRKTPVQARSQTTVQAIFDAAIQVLLSDGISALTTTRVAERAGVSVGTLYQYFPNRRALLAAVFEQHLNTTTLIVEAACAAHHGQSVREMMRGLCDAFIDAKMRNRDASLVLYAVAQDLGAGAMVRAAGRRAEAALVEMLATARDVTFNNLQAPAMMIVSAASGSVQAVLEAGASPKAVAALRQHLVELCVGYLERISLRRDAQQSCLMVDVQISEPRRLARSQKHS
jgi:AcrR family transcriptional regulator